jgi:hypothetical protein
MFYIKLETDDYLLQETEDKFLLEEQSSPSSLAYPGP